MRGGLGRAVGTGSDDVLLERAGEGGSGGPETSRRSAESSGPDRQQHLVVVVGQRLAQQHVAQLLGAQVRVRRDRLHEPGQPVVEVGPAPLDQAVGVEQQQVTGRELEAVVGPDTLFCSNTSSVCITELAAATARPDKFIGLHFFSPVPIMSLVEVIRGRETSDATCATVMALAREMGKTPVEANDFPGFVANRILMPMLNEACYALMEGVAEAEAIDEGTFYSTPVDLFIPAALEQMVDLDNAKKIQ